MSPCFLKNFFVVVAAIQAFINLFIHLIGTYQSPVAVFSAGKIMISKNIKIIFIFILPSKRTRAFYKY